MGSAAPSLSDQVQAILAGTAGFALDPSDLKTLDQVSGGGTPLTQANDPIGRLISKFGTTPYRFIQDTAGARPAWDGVGGVVCDGVDDRLNNGALANACLNGASVAVLAIAFKAPAITGTKQVFNLSTGLSVNVNRLSVTYTAAGALRVSVRRNDSVAGADYDSAGSIIQAGVHHKVVVSVDLTGTNKVTAWVNGVQVIDAALTDGTGAFTATNSANVRFCGDEHNGKVGRVVSAPLLVTGGQRATIEAWLAETAL